MATGKMILIVEDESTIRDLIRINLSAAGYAVCEAEDGDEALEKARKHRPDLILLDWMLPGRDGLSVLRQLKSDSNLAHTPVIMLTAKSEESDIVLGLELGADDYITKPFANKVLIARIRARLRSGEEEGDPEVIRYLSLALYPGERRAVLGDRELSLTCNEFDLLCILAARPGHVFTRSQIVVRTNGEDHQVSARAVDVRIVTLRKKLGVFGERLETVRGVGYRVRA